jgi:hypothetical protein
MLVLKQPNNSRPSGQWSDDGYDVIDAEVRVVLTDIGGG